MTVKRLLSTLLVTLVGAVVFMVVASVVHSAASVRAATEQRDFKAGPRTGCLSAYDALVQGFPYHTGDAPDDVAMRHLYAAAVDARDEVARATPVSVPEQEVDTSTGAALCRRDTLLALQQRVEAYRSSHPPVDPVEDARKRLLEALAEAAAAGPR